MKQIGYASVLHHGWSNAKIAAITGRLAQPYPAGFAVWEDYNRGVRLAQAGEPWQERKKARPPKRFERADQSRERGN